MPFSLTGMDAMIAKLKQVAVKFPDTVAAALYVEAGIEMTESKRRVPFDTGTLRSSGFVQEPVRSGRSISVTLSYGGAAEGYAVPVHENLTAIHPHGQAKYLESVIKESQPHMAARIAARLKLGER